MKKKEIIMGVAVVSCIMLVTIDCIIGHHTMDKIYKKCDDVEAKVIKLEKQVETDKRKINDLEKELETIEDEIIRKSVDRIIEQQNSTETFFVTAYCGCEECCGKWALNRPDGKIIGAAGRELIPDYSVAVDPDVIPLGSIIRMNGKKYRADDTGGMIKGNRIDVYFGSHEEALSFDMGDYEVEVIK